MKNFDLDGFWTSLDWDPLAQLLWLGFLLLLVYRSQQQARLWQAEREADLRRHETQAHEALVRSWHETKAALQTLMAQRDRSTALHEGRVRDLAQALGQALGLDPQRLEALDLAASVHDIGQIQVPFELLTRPRALLPEEMGLVKQHARAGFDILQKVRFPWPVADAVLQHHENFDGSGYPHGLARDDIVLEARILRVADSLDAMLSHRPYRRSLSLEQALAQLEAGSGRQFDPQVVRLCLDLVRTQSFNFAPGAQ